MSRWMRFAAAAGLFAGSMVGSAWLVGALHGDDGTPALPGVDADAPVVAVADGGFGFTEGVAPIDVDSPTAGAELVPVDADSPSGSRPGGAGPGSPGGPAEDPTPPWEIGDASGFAPDPPGVPWLPDLWIRFRDLCADGAGVGCPAGIGGTVLGFGGGEDGSFGDFDVFALNSTPTDWWQCSVDGLGEFEIPALVAANHPARMEITYFPVGEPESSRSAVVDLTDPDGAALRDFVAVTDGGRFAPPFDGVHHCFALGLTTMEPAVVVGDGPTRVVSRFRYQVEVQATSFTGQTDSLSGVVDMGRVRPAVSIMPLSEYEVRVSVPVRSDPIMYSSVAFVETSAGRSCSDLEVAWIAGERVSGAFFSPLSSSSPNTALVVGPSRLDPTYDTWATHEQGLVEGTDYLACIWWVLAPERSWDSATIVDRETRRISTPDMMRTVISLSSIGNNDTDGTIIPSESYRVSAPSACGGGSVALPPAEVDGFPPGDLEPGVALGLDDLLLCVFPGTEQPNYSRVQVEAPDGSFKSFLIPTFRSSTPWETFEVLDISAGEWVAELVVTVTQVDGASNDQPDWVIGTPATFVGAETPAGELPADLRMDYFNSGVETIDRTSLRVRAAFDRPVTLTAGLEGEPCLAAGGATIGTDGVVRREHEFVISGLCTLSDYSVRLVAVTPDGTSTEFSGVRWDWNGQGTTDGYHVSFEVSVGSPDRPGMIAPYHARWHVVVDGQNVRVGAPSRCLESATSERVTAVWGEQVTLDFTVQFFTTDDGPSDRGYCSIGDTSRAAYQEGIAREAVTFIIEDFRLGDVRAEAGEFYQTYPVARPWGSFPGLSVWILGSVDG